MVTVERAYLKQFKDLGLSESILRAVSAEGYTTPTPIQTQVIPAMLAERDVIGIAQTGTGKTASFVLPLLNRISEQSGKTSSKTCGALILTPTRELAQQIAANIKIYGKFMQASVTVVVGGVKPGPQIRALASGADIVVATPGRLLDHMNSGALRLDRTTRVILDEADQMLDLGFMPAIRKIMRALPKQRQTVLMSATMPKQIRALASDFQTDPMEISVAAVSRPIESIAQSVRHTPAAAKRDVLTDILSNASDVRAIVFTRTKRGADKVSRHLESAGLSASAIHGNKSQSQRERTLASFRSGRTSILVATDIAARGIDIDDVTHVINYELPNVAEAYVHRIGRTARAGRTGIAISLCDPAERGLLRDIERLIGNRLAGDGSTSSLDHESRAPLKTGSESGTAKISAKNRPSSQRARTDRHLPVQKSAARPDASGERTPGPDASSAGLARMLGNIGAATPAVAA